MLEHNLHILESVRKDIKPKLIIFEIIPAEFVIVQITPEQVLGPSRPGRKIAILGDTSDSRHMEQISHNASVLVHEATLENELRELCVDKGHSTPGNHRNRSSFCPNLACDQ